MRQRITMAVFALLLCGGVARAQEIKHVGAPSGYLGISFGGEVDEHGERVVVREVSKGSPAEKAGIKSGDEVQRINGLSATNGKFGALARTLTAGDTVQLRVLRDGKPRDFTIVAAPRPAEYELYSSREIVVAPDSVRHLMLRLLDSARVHLDSLRLPSIHIMRGDSMLDLQFGPFMKHDSLFLRDGDSTLTRLFRTRPDDAPRILRDDVDGAHANMIFRSFELGDRSVGGAELSVLDPAMVDYFKTDHGLLVLRVAPETPADRAGLEPGDVIVKAKDRTLTRVDDLRTIVAANPEGVALDVMRKGLHRILQLKSRK